MFMMKAFRKTSSQDKDSEYSDFFCFKHGLVLHIYIFLIQYKIYYSFN